MRFGQWILMVLGWGSAGLLLSARVVYCRQILRSTEAVVDPCPKLSYKCWLGAAVSIAYGVAWYFLMGLKDGFTSGGYLASVAVAAVLGASIARIFCPK